MSFVANLKQARASHSLSKAHDASKCAQFKHVPSRQLAGARPSAQFQNPPIDEDDPMFPRIRLVSRYLSREDTRDALPPHCETLMITDLLKQVRPPDFKRPLDAAPNFVVLGIVASRGEARTSHRGQKFCMMLLSDLKYDISLALHGKAFEKYWKVQPGTLVAILNPRFWVQKSVSDSRTPALSIVDDKALLEIGQAKDLGQCEEMTSQSKHTKRCKNWVDVRKSHVCEFHVEQRTARSKRPELNSASAKLWDPKQGASGKRMAIFKGGDVGWKRGLQVDSQAAVPRSFPDAPVGNVFQMGGLKSSGLFDMPFDSQVRKRRREKRQLENVTDDATLQKRLIARTGPDVPPSARQAQSDRPDVKRYRTSIGVSARPAAEDSDSDLEIVP